MNYFISIVCFLGGVMFFIWPSFYSSTYQMQINFVGGRLFGFILASYGLYLLIRLHKMNKAKTSTDYICPKCQKVFLHKRRDDKILICDECKIDLEELSGFYERHKEFEEEK